MRAVGSMRGAVAERMAGAVASAVAGIMAWLLSSSAPGVFECRHDWKVVRRISAVRPLGHRFGVEHAERAAEQNPVDASARRRPAEAVEGSFRTASPLCLGPRVAEVAQHQPMDLAAGG